VGDFVYLRVTPLKGMQRFHVKGNLHPGTSDRSRSWTARAPCPTS
jgi:hypothetical protein